MIITCQHQKQTVSFLNTAVKNCCTARTPVGCKLQTRRILHHGRPLMADTAQCLIVEDFPGLMGKSPQDSTGLCPWEAIWVPFKRWRGEEEEAPVPGELLQNYHFHCHDHNNQLSDLRGGKYSGVAQNNRSDLANRHTHTHVWLNFRYFHTKKFNLRSMKINDFIFDIIAFCTNS